MRFFIYSFVLLSFVSCGSASTENDNETTDQNQVGDSEVTDDAEVADAVDESEVSDEVSDEADEETTDEDVVYEPAITDKVLIKTTMGDITVGLYGDDIPNTVANFKQYVTDKFFDGLIFHRVIPGFVAQGGGYDKDLVARETRESIDFEASPLIKHVKYVVSMARSSVNSATSQFFIMLGDAPHLDFETEEDLFDKEKYPCTAFGEVVEGFDVVDAIGAVETETSGMFEDVPVEPIVIDSAILVN